MKLAWQGLHRGLQVLKVACELLLAVVLVQPFIVSHKRRLGAGSPLNRYVCRTPEPSGGVDALVPRVCRSLAL